MGNNQSPIIDGTYTITTSSGIFEIKVNDSIPTMKKEDLDKLSLSYNGTVDWDTDRLLKLVQTKHGLFVKIRVKPAYNGFPEYLMIQAEESKESKEVVVINNKNQDLLEDGTYQLTTSLGPIDIKVKNSAVVLQEKAWEKLSSINKIQISKGMIAFGFNDFGSFMYLNFNDDIFENPEYLITKIE
jgi:hypothetical protein